MKSYKPEPMPEWQKWLITSTLAISLWFVSTFFSFLALLIGICVIIYTDDKQDTL